MNAFNRVNPEIGLYPKSAEIISFRRGFQAVLSQDWWSKNIEHNEQLLPCARAVRLRLAKDSKKLEKAVPPCYKAWHEGGGRPSPLPLFALKILCRTLVSLLWDAPVLMADV